MKRSWAGYVGDMVIVLFIFFFAGSFILGSVIVAFALLILDVTLDRKDKKTVTYIIIIFVAAVIWKFGKNFISFIGG